MGGKHTRKGEKRTDGYLELQRVGIRKRQQKVEDFLLRGETSRGKIAHALGVTTPTVFHDIEVVHQKWADEDLKRTRDRRNYRIRQTALLLQQNLNSFEISRRSQVQTMTTWHEEKCKICKGTGMVDGSEVWCPECNGEGIVRIETVTERQVGNAGDVAFLEAARKCLQDMAKLEGLHARKGRPKGEQSEVHFHKHLEVNPFVNASAEAIIRAKEVIEELRLSTVGGKTIEVEPLSSK